MRWRCMHPATHIHCNPFSASHMHHHHRPCRRRRLESHCQHRPVVVWLSHCTGRGRWHQRCHGPPFAARTARPGEPLHCFCGRRGKQRAGGREGCVIKMHAWLERFLLTQASVGNLAAQLITAESAVAHQRCIGWSMYCCGVFVCTFSHGCRVQSASVRSSRLWAGPGPGTQSW